MTSDTMIPREQKLQNLRRVLWLVFAGVSLPVMMLMVLAYFFLGDSTPGVSGSGAALPTFLLVIGITLSIAAIGAVCLAVYYVLKHRLDRDDGIFL